MENMDYKVTKQDGKSSGTIALDPQIFGAPIRADFVHAAVVWQLNKRRSGTHSALTKGEMKGGSKKPWKQKGTGRARAGDSNSPHWVGGGVAHGPLPRKYESRVTKRARRQALLSVLSDKRETEKLIVLDSLTIADGKTKTLAALLKGIGVVGKKAVFLLEDKGSMLAGRNIPGLTALPVDGINVYDLVRHPYLVCTKTALTALQDKLLGAISAGSADAEDDAEELVKAPKRSASKKSSPKAAEKKAAARVASNKAAAK